MRLQGRVEKLEAAMEAARPSVIHRPVQIIGETQAELDRQTEQLRAEGFEGMIIAVQIVSPGDYEPAPGGGWQPTETGLRKGFTWHR
jgi:hypothetical protein